MQRRVEITASAPGISHRSNADRLDCGSPWAGTCVVSRLELRGDMGSGRCESHLGRVNWGLGSAGIERAPVNHRRGAASGSCGLS
jgi:hypothetical protein